MKRDHFRAKRCGSNLGNIARPRPQGHFDQTQGEVHTHFTDRESLQISNSLQCANKRVALRVRIRSGADSKGSNGAAIRPSRTTDKSQEGTLIGCTGLSRRTPRINTETNLQRHRFSEGRGSLLGRNGEHR